jgi:hypothetical protein
MIYLEQARDFLVIAAVVSQAWLGVRWLYRKVRDAQVAGRFVEDMATNHLPHIYDAQKRIAGALSVELPEPPPIRFMDFKDE